MFCTRLLQSESSLAEVEEPTGHEPTIAAQRYPHLAKRNLTNATKLLKVA